VRSLAFTLVLAGCHAGASPDVAGPDVDDLFPVEVAEGLAPTPPMGWNSWNRFACDLDADLIAQTAEAMVSSGMRDAGYTYVNLDDCWQQVDRDEAGHVVPAPNFPEGIAPVADAIHALDLKLGIYSDRGTATCGGRAGSQGHEVVDAQDYAAWGVDYLKYDNCNADTDPAVQQAQYETMSDALAASGRPMVYSLCAWAFHEWGVDAGHLWRVSADIVDGWGSSNFNLTQTRRAAAYAQPNGWNDPDMLEVGNGGMTDLEYRAQFSLWALSAAPLIAGNDLRTMSEETLTILTNEEVIALDQDALGLQGVPVRFDGQASVWAKPLNQSGARGVILFNESEIALPITVSWVEIGLRPGEATVRDLWKHQDLGAFTDRFTATVQPHEALTLRLVGTEPLIPSGTAHLSDLTPTYAANLLGPVERDGSNGTDAPGDGGPLSLAGMVYERGLGVSAPSRVIFRLGGRCSSFHAVAGMDDSAAGTASFEVWGDDERLYDSGPVAAGVAQPVDVDLQGKHRLTLLVKSAGDVSEADLADWADATVDCE
jgi:alpha-galactosidase